LRVFRFALFAALIWLGAGVSMAATSPTSPSSTPPLAASPGVPTGTVVVTARPRPVAPQSLDRVVHGFVRSHGAATHIGQLARWRDPVCPQTTGLPPGYDAFVSSRVTEVAAQVGAPTGPPTGHCDPNVVIVFTVEPQTFMNEIRKKKPALLGFHYASQAVRLATVSQPIQGWYVTATRGDGGDVEVDDSCCPGPGGRPGSRLGSGMSSEFVAILIVADASKVAGYPIGSVADYIAMLALSHPASLTACSEISSISDLMAPACDSQPSPGALTSEDLAYLKALYRTDLTLFLPDEQSNITTLMKASIVGR
jgi:hypothetical protein